MGQQVAIAAKFQKVGNTLCFKVMKQGSFTLAPLAPKVLNLKYLEEILLVFKICLKSHHFQRCFVTFVCSNQSHL